MATNSWNALVADVNGKISEMNAAISGANGAASTAKTAAETANEKAAEADAAAQEARDAADAAEAETQKWAGATADASTLEPGSDATVTINESGGVKKFTFGIPRGAPFYAMLFGNPAVDYVRCVDRSSAAKVIYTMPVQALKSLVAKPKCALSIEEMNGVIIEG